MPFSFKAPGAFLLITGGLMLAQPLIRFEALFRVLSILIFLLSFSWGSFIWVSLFASLVII